MRARHLNRRQKRVLKRKLIAFLGDTVAVLIVGAFVGWFIYAWLTEPVEMPAAPEHFGEIQVADNYWLSQADYEQMCRERDAYKAAEEAEAQRLHDQIEAYQARIEQPEVNIEEQPATLYELSESDQYLLARIAMAEAEGESLEIKKLVILVVLNRVESDTFPNTVKDVLWEKNQFSPMHNGRWDRVEPNEECWQAVAEVLELTENPSQGATYFESCDDPNNWHSRHLTFLYKKGAIRFYK